jgi:transcription initiation factor TFIID subunit 13
LLQLFGYGDDENPYTETVDFLEELVLEFISDMTLKAMETGRTGKVQGGNSPN